MLLILRLPLRMSLPNKVVKNTPIPSTLGPPKDASRLALSIDICAVGGCEPMLGKAYLSPLPGRKPASNSIACCPALSLTTVVPLGEKILTSPGNQTAGESKGIRALSSCVFEEVDAVISAKSTEMVVESTLKSN